MSITVGYFFNSELPLQALGESLGGILGCRFAPYEGDSTDLFCRLFSLETSLSGHSLENDRELDFSNTRYQFDTRTPSGDSDLRDFQLGVMATIPALLHRRAGISSGLLVYDCQILLARYEVRNECFFDAVSGQPVVFPNHFHHVYAQVKVI